MAKNLYERVAGEVTDRTRTEGTIVVDGKKYLDVSHSANLVGRSEYTIRNWDYSGYITDTVTRDRVKYYLEDQVKAALNMVKDRKKRTQAQKVEKIMKNLHRACRLLLGLLDLDESASNQVKDTVRAYLTKHLTVLDKELKG